MTKKTFLASVGTVTGAALLYRGLLRRPILTWGATAAEAGGAAARATSCSRTPTASRRARSRSTRRRAAVWPWIAQMGPSPRGGAYTYDWIENLLGLNMHSADRVLPEFQHPQVGDGFGYGANKMSFKRRRARARRWPRSRRTATGSGRSSSRSEDGKTRLISRNRFRLPRLRDKIGMIPMEPGVARDGAEDAVRDQAAGREVGPRWTGWGRSAGSRPLTDSSMA